MFLFLLVSYIILSLYVSANKKKLLTKAGVEIGKLIGGTVTVSDLSVSLFNNFPYLSIGLKKVAVRDSLFSRHGHNLFEAEKLFLRLHPLKLLLARISINKVEIDSGALYVFTDTNGYTNDYLLRGKKQFTRQENNSATEKILDKVELNHFAVTLEDLTKKKLFDFYINHLDVKTDNSDSSYNFMLKESILVKSVAFNLANGSYATSHLLEGSYMLRFFPTKKELRFDSITINISKQPFRFSGIFSLGNKQQFALQVSTKNILLDFAKSLLTKKTSTGISLVSLKSPLDVNASISGSLTGGDPFILARWGTKNNSITTPLLNFSNCSFDGLYTNEVARGVERNDPNSKVEVYNFRGDWQGLTLTSNKIIIKNLTTPIVTATLQSHFLLTQLNALVQTKTLSLTEGRGSMQINYKGPIDHITPQNASLNGLLNIQNGNILMRAPQSTLSNCTAAIRFVNSDVIIDSLRCKIHGHPIRFWGEAKNALAFLGDAPDKVSLTLNGFAALLNIEHLSDIISRKIPAKTKPKDIKAGGLAKTVQKIDNLLSSGKIAVSLNADTLVFHRFEARRLNARILIDENAWQLKNVSLLHGNGSMAITANVAEEGKSRFLLKAGMKMKDVDAQKVWYQFENFGIPALTYKNIKGLLSANATVSLYLDKSGKFDMGTMEGQADFSIKNGALVNFTPLQNVQTFVFKNRDFTDIAFAEIKDKISFKNNQVTINRMEINSTALSLFVEGVYAIRGNTDITIQLPLANLKKRDKDYKPENMGAQRGGGMSVFLRAVSGNDGVIKIKYDPFARFRKSTRDNIDSKKN